MVDPDLGGRGKGLAEIPFGACLRELVRACVIAFESSRASLESFGACHDRISYSTGRHSFRRAPEVAVRSPYRAGSARPTAVDVLARPTPIPAEGIRSSAPSHLHMDSDRICMHARELGIQITPN